jgi:hypothetical protein
MKAYLIDSTAHTVTAVTLKDGDALAEYYRLIDCETVEAKRITARGDMLFFDEEGLLREPIPPFFHIAGWPYPVAGNALVVGREDPLSGKTRDPSMPLDAVQQAVTFLLPAEAVDIWNKQRAMDQEAMREMREAGINVIDAGLSLALDDNGLAVAD